MHNNVDWDQRFEQQARWTKKLRHYIYKRIGISQLNHIIEIGCGTGAVLNDFTEVKDKYIFGLDISEKFIHIAQNRLSNACMTIGDANELPFKDCSFDVILCHFFLLWIHEPINALREMKRIARKDGIIIVFAEPDYSSRIDYPDELIELGQSQITSLINQGADPFIGRRIGSLYQKAGITLVEMGILGGQWSPQPSSEVEDNEWQILLYDLQFLAEQEKNASLNQSELAHLRNIHRQALKTGERVLFIPTFYAWGKVDK